MEDTFNYVIAAPDPTCRSDELQVRYFYGREVQHGTLTDAQLKLAWVKQRVNEDAEGGYLPRDSASADTYAIWRLEKVQDAPQVRATFRLEYRGFCIRHIHDLENYGYEACDPDWPKNVLYADTILDLKAKIDIHFGAMQ